MSGQLPSEPWLQAIVMIKNQTGSTALSPPARIFKPEQTAGAAT
jgi:hypothetical protein